MHAARYHALTHHKDEEDTDVSMAPCPNHSMSPPILFKSMVGFSVAAIALSQVALPSLGISANFATEGAIAALGAIIGFILARRS
jgi:hypothetical protein